MVGLNETLTWEEIYERVINKIGHKLKRNELPAFKKWFMKRESIGYCFDAVLILRCFFISNELKKNLDHFICVCGREGFGKTTIATQIAAWVNPNFDIKNIVYGTNDYVNILRKKAGQYEQREENIPTESILLDEGTELLSREALSLSNRVLTKTFFVQRALKFLVIVNIPNFHLLDTVVRMHRVRTLIYVKNRGRYRCITGKGITAIAEYGHKTKSVMNVRTPAGTFFDGDFNKNFPKTIDKEAYEIHKMVGIKELLEELKEDTVSKKLIASHKVAKSFDMKPDKMIRLIKSGKVKGKQIGGTWYITRESYEKLKLVE